MGLLTFLLKFLRSFLLPVLYFGGILTAIATIFRRAEWGLFLMVALIPQPNVFYKLYSFPMGKNFLDILFFSILIGIFFNKGGYEKKGNSVLIIVLVLASYFAVWNCSRNFSLAFPITLENPMLRPWKSYAFMVLLYLLTFNAIKDSEDQRKILAIIVVVVVLFISVRSFRSFTAGGGYSEASRSNGPFEVVGLGANHFGAFIAHYSALVLGLLFLDDNRWRKILYAVTVLFSLHPLFFTYSRGAYVGALVVLVFFGLVQKRILLILVFALMVAWKTLLPTSVVDRITMTTNTEEGGVEHSAAVRLELWEYALEAFKKNPVIGVGYGGFQFCIPEGEYSRWKDTHNYYLKMLSEQGIVGLGLFLVVLVVAFRSGWRLWKAGKEGFERGLGLGFMGCVLACASTNLFGDRWSYFEMGGYFWVLWGLVDRGILMAQQKIASSAPSMEQTEWPSTSAGNDDMEGGKV